MPSKIQWRYDRLTWPEMREQIAHQPQPVVAIPFDTVEDHGPHLPLSTDNDILAAVLAECGRRAKGDILVTPTIPVGLDEHHMDFPPQKPSGKFHNAVYNTLHRRVLQN